MTPAIARARSIVGVVMTALSVASCNDLLEVDITGTVTGESVNSAAGANALRIGALQLLNQMTLGNTALFERGLWIDGGLVADEYKTASPRQQSGELDIRVVTQANTNISADYATLHRARARAREAIAKLTEFMPTPAWGIGQMYLVLAVAEMELAEHFCNGAPLSEVIGGEIVYGQPKTNAEVFTIAAAHLDTALTFLTATDAPTVAINTAARILKGRIQVHLGQWSAAATTVAGISTTYSYPITFALGTGDNAHWNFNISVRELAVGDSVDPAGRINNAIPFARLNDPRVPVLGSSTGTSSQGIGADGGTNLVVQRIWAGRSDAGNLVSGLDARLIEAEAQLQLNTPAGRTAMMGILNALRAAPPALSSSYTPAAMPALPDPASQADAVTLYFREKAFWTFGRGQRFSDLRRLVRQYGRPQDQVWPTGTFFKGGVYGTNVNFDVPPGELNNPNFTACLDRNA